MRLRLAVAAGRLVRAVARRRGGGSAIPGYVALRIAPRFLERTIADLPLGVIAVSGSNGKSTTTHMVAAILRAHDLRVFTNPSGGNLPQGIASAVLADADAAGRLKADIAVLEVDEAYGVELTRLLTPTVVLLLNVQIDQLNRFFEPDRVAGMLAKIAATATSELVLNRDDEHLVGLADELPAGSSARVSYFGTVPELLGSVSQGMLSAPRFGGAATVAPASADVVATALQGRDATLDIAGVPTRIRLPARGVHYAVDAAGAIAASRAALGDRFSADAAVRALDELGTVYGRGETLVSAGEEIEIIMMKNPASLQMNLDSLDAVPEQVFLAVDDGTPDPSWLYDIDLSKLDHADVLSGSKGYQLAVRLGYEGIRVGEVEPDLRTAVKRFLALPRPTAGRKTMIVNYEQMMLIRRMLGYTDLEGGQS
ncbi:MurT ligase domain-containing protein [Planctomonas psychrotolerans]|uniref:MurT ligase domain-containing protein n=1 Tax=Planctomonas psychrotolerans TaxID=2528712 RepID=UPI0012397549|nr:MurT ligase domain-containing protein [Planctomonas psychrotolerans]